MITSKNIDWTGNEFDSTILEPDDSHKKKKKILRRKSGQVQKSNDSKRSTKGPKIVEFTSQFKPTYLKTSALNVFSNIELQPAGISRKQVREQPSSARTSGKFGRTLNLDLTAEDLNEDIIKAPKAGQMNNHIFKRIQNLEEQLGLRNQQIQLIEGERQKIKREHRELEIKYKILEENNRKLFNDVENIKQEMRQLQIQFKRNQSEKNSLVKKIEFLENISFSTETKNIQSMREQYLEKEIDNLKQRVNKDKSEIEKFLQNQLEKSKQQLFKARKFIQSMEINNKCIQMKLKEKATVINHSEEYQSLRTKYRKFLVEFKDLRKQHEKLLYQHKALQAQYLKKVDDDFSLELSIF